MSIKSEANDTGEQRGNGLIRHIFWVKVKWLLWAQVKIAARAEVKELWAEVKW